MTQTCEVEERESLARLLSLVKSRIRDDRAANVERFVARYYRGVAAEDLAERSDENLLGAALAHWNLAQPRRPGAPNIRVYNPQVDRDGWETTHTVVQIVFDDMPFLVDSVRMSLNDLGFTNHLVIHPIIRVARDGDGDVIDVPKARGDGSGDRESYMHFEVTRDSRDEVLDRVRKRLENVLRDVRAAVEDWPAMREKLAEATAELDRGTTPIDDDSRAEARAFLAWIGKDNFTFLGYREYEIRDLDGVPGLYISGSPGLGVLRGGEVGRPSRAFQNLSPEARERVFEPGALVMSKTLSRSNVHRAGHMDYIGVKCWDAEGRLTGERRFVGLYTSTAYNRSPREIPLLRRKLDDVLASVEYAPDSHAGKALLNILETFPRDVLFQIRSRDLLETATAILQLEERQRVRLFVLRELYGQFFTCLVYLPRERFGTTVRRQVEATLENAIGGVSTEFSIQYTESVLARLCYVIRVTSGGPAEFDVEQVQRQIVRALRSWNDDLADVLAERVGEERANDYVQRYGQAFRADYREYYPAAAAVHDIELMESIEADRGPGMNLYRPVEARPGTFRFKLVRTGKPVPLSTALPMFENMGLAVDDEHPSIITRADSTRFWMHDFGLQYDDGLEPDLAGVKGLFEDCFGRVWDRVVENDGFNRLVLRARLGWREIVILRAYCKYLRQAPVAFSQEYMIQALNRNPLIARLLIELFRARFDPDRDEDGARGISGIEDEIRAALDEVVSLDEDRILRSFLGVLRATLRTNYFQREPDGSPRPYLSLKLDPGRIPELPEPRPMFEIFVYSPKVEGVHLRGGSVARGGLRWSDRREDFRTEVLGLVKAQMVKNAVIVPMGSKGGFVTKDLPAVGTREEFQEEVVRCYRTFVRGLLDVTDNLEGSRVIPPPRVVRHDGDDPYLVVAADKGTATFSDIANEIATERGFWLGDGFASGGSAGYDHKKMGITARGAWESIKRHFRELALDTQGADFTVVGIGDMGGDVFGNGMLQSPHIRLLGAYNHQHLFLDPDPDPVASFRERERLFNLPRSSWADYDPDLISAGGGVFPRSAKSITVSPEVRDALDLDARLLTPNELISALLRAPVDLLWNGGIGTYVKASSESHADVGDRANDGVRVDASALRCRVVGEGGNLGLTQLARIQFAAQGGRIYTDAVDNSGGVDCSDREVNIKILLNRVVADGDMTTKQRNRLLEEMTDEVAGLVLRNNYMQTQAVSIANSQAGSLLEVQERLMEAMEREGSLVREIEFLPGKEQVQERLAAGQGLTPPELSILLAYVKIEIYRRLLDSDLADDPYLVRELGAYFPAPIRDRFADRLPDHPLRREIVATVTANGMVNRAGITFAFRLGEETGAGASDIARAYLAAREIFGMERVWAEIEALDNRVPAAIQLEMLLEERKLVERSTRWILRNQPWPSDIESMRGFFSAGVSHMTRNLAALVGDAEREAMEGRAAELVEAGVPPGLASRVAGSAELFSSLDIVEVADRSGADLDLVARVYFILGSAIDLHWVRDRIVALPRRNRWDALARTAMRDELYRQHRDLAVTVLTGHDADADAESLIERWTERQSGPVARSRQVIADLKASGAVDFSMLSIALLEYRSLHQTPVT